MLADQIHFVSNTFMVSNQENKQILLISIMKHWLQSLKLYACLEQELGLVLLSVTKSLPSLTQTNSVLISVHYGVVVLHPLLVLLAFFFFL